ncbi:MAG: ATP-dependent chaperone ClpB, partial [Rubripirellula sp.]
LLKTEIRRIVGLQLEELGKRLTENGLQLEVSEDAMDEVASVGYDPTFGARPLKRVIQREIQNPLAKALLTDDYPDGATVHVDYDGTRFVFSERAASKAVEV